MWPERLPERLTQAIAYDHRLQRAKAIDRATALLHLRAESLKLRPVGRAYVEDRFTGSELPDLVALDGGPPQPGQQHVIVSVDVERRNT